MRLLTIVGGLAGAAVLVGIEKGGASALSPADGMALLSSLSFACLTVYVRKVGGDVGGWEKTFFTTTIGALTALIAVTLVPEGPVPALATVTAAFPALLLCMVWQVVLLAVFMWGSAYVEPGRVTIYLLLEVVGAVVSASLLTDDPFGWREVFGCILICRRRPARGPRRAAPRETLVNRAVSVISCGNDKRERPGRMAWPG